MAEAIVTVTKKGQATIPSQMRKRHKIGRKVLVVDTDVGVLLKPVADPVTEKGSLKKLFADTDSRELIEQARAVEYRREKTKRR